MQACMNDSVSFGSFAVLTPLEYVAYEEQPEFTFQCTVTLPGLRSLSVLVDGEQLGTESLNQRGITISEPMQLGDTTSHQLNITISATEANGNTTIVCIATGNAIISDTATCTFKVQGRSYL